MCGWPAAGPFLWETSSWRPLKGRDSSHPLLVSWATDGPWVLSSQPLRPPGSLAAGFQEVSGGGAAGPALGLELCPLDVLSPCALRKLMDKQTFCSSQTTSNTSRYAAALYRQGTREWAPGAVLMEAGGGREQDGDWDGDRPSLHSAGHQRGQASRGDKSVGTGSGRLVGLLASHCPG